MVIILPDYEQLDIKNYDQFLKESKKEFNDIWKIRENKEVTLEDFSFLGFISSGTYGKIYVASNKKSSTYHAIKVIKKNQIKKLNQFDHIRNEKFIMQRLNFPLMVYLENCFKDNSNIHFVMPFYKGGELFEHIQTFGGLEIIESIFIGAQIVLCLEYLHYLDIIHRDLKPENIVFDHTGYIKLTDFGFAKIVRTRTYTVCGTPEYLAPEIVRNKGYSKSVDFWSLGVLLYEMTSGKLPYIIKDIMQFCDLNFVLKLKYPTTFPCELQDLISNLLEVDLTRRFGNLKNGVNDVKNHIWFSTISWLSLFNKQPIPPFIPLEKKYKKLNHKVLDSEVNNYEEEFADF